MRTRLTLASVLALLLTGCQNAPTSPDAILLDDPMKNAPAVTSGFDADSLASLLLAEFAGQRGDYRRAAEGYLDVNQRYASPALAERATLAARYADDSALLERTALRWQRLDKEATTPRHILASLAVQRGDWETALAQRLKVADQESEAELAALAEQAIAQDADITPLLKRLHAFVERHPEDLDAQLATAQLEAANGDTAVADARLARLAKAPEAPAEVWLTRSTIALHDGALDEARRYTRQGLARFPHDSRLRLTQAQIHLAAGNLEAADEDVKRLLSRYDDTAPLRLALAQMYLDAAYPDGARRILLPLLDRDDTPTAAYLMLGRIAEQAGDIDNALLYYRQVPSGDGFIEARAQAAKMLIRAQRPQDASEFLRIERLRHPDQRIALLRLEIDILDAQGKQERANELLDTAIAKTPASTALRFQHAMRAYQQGDLETMEADLKAIIEREPNNAEALNALGYTLSNDMGRHREALPLIEKAYRLEPDSPAILDSLGWVYFHLGRAQEALPYLREAYRGQPGQEIAAHLAEVLAATGRHDQARELIEDAQRRFSPHPLIDALLRRQPELAPDDTASDAVDSPHDTEADS
ncbi:tetratricopeptide repeat protein [Chromohalobacter marismortui]|uniref:Tetratricopeptide repeat protein n=1 Tax=Chromohalobacter marismortui TaxID=42055 RepID=A0A4R7NVE0_9GAMM|nr:MULTISPECIES: tetratricopeptide repeat protein [Chromohalobacter]MCI0510446.1 tetratricopeptide repeat protein [Chromohalobacter sp.]MCI0594201.1 tetratricopeptide repeat protein [Chromohalobacter sp.]TDU24978.1 tetratricopeptide repeat protein [Chromohalobacter marismortui]